MSGRPLPRFACDCAWCCARAEDEWDRFVDGHQEVANHLRDVFLNPEGRRPVDRVMAPAHRERGVGRTVGSR